jgi:hypothetical protein
MASHSLSTTELLLTPDLLLTEPSLEEGKLPPELLLATSLELPCTKEEEDEPTVADELLGTTEEELCLPPPSSSEEQENVNAKESPKPAANAVL